MAGQVDLGKTTGKAFDEFILNSASLLLVVKTPVVLDPYNI